MINAFIALAFFFMGYSAGLKHVPKESQPAEVMIYITDSSLSQPPEQP